MYERTIKWKWLTIYHERSTKEKYIYLLNLIENLCDYGKKNGSQIICLS